MSSNTRFVGLSSSHKEMTAAIFSGVLLFFTWYVDITILAKDILYILAYVIGGYVKAKEGLISIFKQKELDVNILMFMASIGAACTGNWLEGGLLIFIFSVSGALESYTLSKSERDLSSLIKLQPESAWIYKENGNTYKVPIDEVLVGDCILIKPGERIPLDGIIDRGSSYVDQSPITGESIPVHKKSGDEIFAGTLNGSGSLVVRVSHLNKDTLFSKIIRLVGEVKKEVPHSQQSIEKIEKIYVRLVLISTLLVIFIPYLVGVWTMKVAIYRAMVFLVVASPCALVASTMPAVLSSISNGARKGIIFRNGKKIEALSKVKVVAFDKTGTLTRGYPVVRDVYSFNELSKEEVLFVAGSIEQASEHPLGKAITKKAKELNLDLVYPTEFDAEIGWGVKATLNEENWHIGKVNYFSKFDLKNNIKEAINKFEQQGMTVVMVGRYPEIVGIIGLQDSLREDTLKAISTLKSLGIKTAMLTGDQEATAVSIGKQLKLDKIYSNLLPEEKMEIIKDIKREYGMVAMVGDGINDTPALAASDIGIAMGKRGNDSVLHTADIILMKDDLTKVATAYEIGRRMSTIVNQNITFSVLVILTLILTNFLGIMTLPLGVVGHEGSTILVILNSLRLLK